MSTIDNQEISAAEHFAQMVEGKGNASGWQASKLISMRIPLIQLSRIDAFAEMINSNRNKAIVQLFEVAIEEVLNKLQDDVVLDNFRKLEGKKLSEFINESPSTVEIYEMDPEKVVPGKRKKKTTK